MNFNTLLNNALKSDDVSGHVTSSDSLSRPININNEFINNHYLYCHFVSELVTLSDLYSKDDRTTLAYYTRWDDKWARVSLHCRQPQGRRASVRCV